MLMDVPRIGLGVDVPAGCNRTGESREGSNRRVRQYPLHVTGTMIYSTILWIAGIALPLAFFCRSCRGRAQMVEADGALHRVECLTCGIALEGSDVQDMHEHLLNPLREQEGADIPPSDCRREGTLGRVDNSGRR